MTRRFYIERVLRQIYGGYVSDDSAITVNLVNSWLNDALGIAAKQCYKEAIQLEGIGYVNNSFYATYKGISVTEDEQFVYKIELPQLPLGLGRNEGISTLKFKSSTGEISIPCIPISESQATYFQGMRPMPNKVIYKPEGGYILAYTTLMLSAYTASVTMVSGGNDADLDSTINVPNDYFPVIVEYVKSQLAFERQMPVDVQNDGLDAIKTT